MFENTLIIYNEMLKGSGLRVVEEVTTFFNEKKYDMFSLNEIKKEYFFNRDLVVAIGGDATVLRPAGYLNDAPILGINAQPEKSRGFLTSLDSSNISCLNDILSGNYKVIQRVRARLNRNGNTLDDKILNEVYFGTKDPGTSMRYSISYQGITEEQRSSGLVVCTGTGSTGRYNSMAQDPLSKEKREVSFSYVLKELRFLVDDLNRDFKDPNLIHGEIKEHESIILESRMRYNGYIVIDGHRYFDFDNEDKFEVKISDKSLNVVVNKT